jgi:hypothetical protein
MSVISNLKALSAAKVIGALSIPAAVVVSGMLVMGGSSAAFSGETSNEGNSWTAGTVALENDRGTAMFAANGISPNYTETHCITVSSTSTIPTTLKMYTADVTSTGVPTTLAENLDVQVTRGAGSTDADCTGFAPAGAADFNGKLAAFGTANSDFSNGVGSHTLAAGGSSQYKITVSLPEGAPNTLQGTTAGASFVWEAQG